MGFSKEAIDDDVSFMNTPAAAGQKETAAASPPEGERSGKFLGLF